jgi:hypothetical protein
MNHSEVVQFLAGATIRACAGDLQRKEQIRITKSLRINGDNGSVRAAGSTAMQ